VALSLAGFAPPRAVTGGRAGRPPREKQTTRGFDLIREGAFPQYSIAAGAAGKRFSTIWVH